MFAKTIIDSDAFLDMPVTTQLLYFHLSMRADDDGFINKPKTVMRMCSCKDDDLKLLALKKFIIPFESGVVVIKHWKIHNYIAKDRYIETKYKDEKSMLVLDENKAYTECLQGIAGIEEDEEGDKRSARKTVYYPNDEKLDNAFADYVDMRKKTKKPMTERAIQLAQKKLDELSKGNNDVAIQILEQSVMNCWQGLFPLREEARKLTKKVDDFMEMWRDA